MPNAAEFSIGLDLGGTNLRAAAISHDGRLLDSVRGHTAWSEGREAIVSEMVEAIDTLRGRGGVPGAWDLFAPAMIEETRRRSFTFRATNTCIEKAALGDDAGLFGAARLPWLVVS